MATKTIAIDGHSSTGKSTLAKQLATHLGFVYIDSGAMYRAITCYALSNFWKDNKLQKDELLTALPKLKLTFLEHPNFSLPVIHLNGKCVEAEIRSMKISEHVSEIAAIPEVREAMVAMQRQMAEANNVVMDGRDIGTVVFPKADLKLFMTASSEIRAQRRYEELLAKGHSVSFNEVLQNVISRDKKDSTRAVSPLKKAQDAILIDNSALSISTQFQKILEVVKKHLAL